MGLIVTTSTSLFSLFVPTPHPPRPVLASQLTPYNVFSISSEDFCRYFKLNSNRAFKVKIAGKVSPFLENTFESWSFVHLYSSNYPDIYVPKQKSHFLTFVENNCLSVMINGHVKILFAGTERTTLKAGSSINITWHLAYPHRGGFRLEVCYPFDCWIVFVIDVLTR